MPNIGSPLNITALNGAPLLSNAYYTTSVARLAAGQARHESWSYYQEGIGFFQLRPLSKCFLSDGVTAATNRGTWGTLDSHWLFAGVQEPVPLAVREFVVGGDFDPNTFVMTTVLPSNLAALCRKGNFFVSGRYWYIYEFSETATGLVWQRNFVGATAPSTTTPGTGDGVDLSKYARLDSPTFINSPTAPTVADSNDASTAIATTSFVQKAIARNLNQVPYARAPKVYFVCGRGQTEPGVVGVRDRPFLTPQAAHDAMPINDLGIMIISPGGDAFDSLGRSAYGSTYTQTKHIRTFCEPGVVFTNSVLLGAYNGTSGGSHYWFGGHFVASSLVLLCRQNDSKISAVVEGALFTENAGIQHIANTNTPTNWLDEYLILNCRFLSTRPAPASDDVNTQRGPIRSNGRTVFGPSNIILENTLVTTVNTPAISFSTVPGNTVTLRGTTELRPGPGQPEAESISNKETGPVLIKDALIEARYQSPNILTDTVTNIKYRLSIADGLIKAVSI